MGLLFGRMVALVKKRGDLFIEDLKLYGFIRYTTRHHILSTFPNSNTLKSFSLKLYKKACIQTFTIYT